MSKRHIKGTHSGTIHNTRGGRICRKLMIITLSDKMLKLLLYYVFIFMLVLLVSLTIFCRLIFDVNHNVNARNHLRIKWCLAMSRWMAGRACSSCFLSISCFIDFIFCHNQWSLHQSKRCCYTHCPPAQVPNHLKLYIASQTW